MVLKFEEWAKTDRWKNEAVVLKYNTGRFLVLFTDKPKFNVGEEIILQKGTYISYKRKTIVFSNNSRYNINWGIHTKGDIKFRTIKDFEKELMLCKLEDYKENKL